MQEWVHASFPRAYVRSLPSQGRAAKPDTSVLDFEEDLRALVCVQRDTQEVLKGGNELRINQSSPFFFTAT